MSERMRVKITGGPSVHTLRVVDMETDKELPIADLTFRADGYEGHVAATVTLLVHEIEVELEADAVEMIERVRRCGGVARARVVEPSDA